jgi:myo-inositol-1-phosphate synthase
MSDSPLPFTVTPSEVAREASDISPGAQKTVKRLGVWLVGACGSVATIAIAGQAVMRRGLGGAIGLVTSRPEFASADLAPIESFVFGGHEIRKTSLVASANGIMRACGVADVFESIVSDLEEVDGRIRPGITRACGREIERLGINVPPIASDLEAIRLIRKDLDAFKAELGLTHLVVVNVASTEAVVDANDAWQSLSRLDEALTTEPSVLPASSLYAYAALSAGDAYVNFTPSLGSRVRALNELAERRGAVHAGSDGKTGETLVKSVLTELFVRRNLKLRSWFGQNILGNDDGRTLSDPMRKAAKLHSKDQVIRRMVGYQVETGVGIDYVQSLGETKVAWDYVHFEGFLKSQMNLQFTWSGYDSILAAPLVLDLVRLCHLAQLRGERGILGALAPFFKDPMGSAESAFVAQDESLLKWITEEHGKTLQ